MELKTVAAHSTTGVIYLAEGHHKHPMLCAALDMNRIVDAYHVLSPSGAGLLAKVASSFRAVWQAFHGKMRH